MRSSNPALSANTFRDVVTTDDRMSIQGTVAKSFVLILLVMTAATYSWKSAYPDGWSESSVPAIPGWYFPVIIAALVAAFVLIFKKTWGFFLAPVYAILEGLSLGALSAIFEMKYPGIVMQAMLCTTATFMALLVAYSTRFIKATENMKLGIAAATGGIALVYLIDMILGFFGIHVPYIHEGGPIGIGISLVITAVAAFNLVLDFDFIEQGADQGAPKYMEWYAAFGLLVTLVWLYVEFLRLLSKSRKR